jgi:Tfp pilus assembly protein PilN
MRAVNLLPKEISRSTGLKLNVPVAVAAAAPILAGCLVFVGYTLSHSSLHSKQGDLAAVRAQVAALPVSTTRVQPGGPAIISERTARRSALDSALLDRLDWDVALQDVARVLPGDVWITTLGFTSPTPADSTAPPAANPNGFTISGYTYSQLSVARLLTRLQLLPMLSGVTLGSTSSSTVANKPVVQFSVTAAVAPAINKEET